MQVRQTSSASLRLIRRYGSRFVRKASKAIQTRLLGAITHVETTTPVAALTFDDGPHPVYTPCLLDILERHGAHATFFMIGKYAQMSPDLVQRAAQAGHAIANHTWDHPLFLSVNSRERRRQIQAGARAIAPYGATLFRPPKGHQHLGSRLDILWSRHQVVTWNMHAEDWQPHDAVWIADRLERQIKPGGIILLHDAIWDPMVEGVTDRRPILEGVDMFLQSVGARFRFVTVPELFRYGRVVRENWYRP